MVPAARMLDTARETGADLIGLSGLRRRSRRCATWPRRWSARSGAAAAHRWRDHVATHTTVKIEPQYHGP
jgi:cobalamin-dependent methionine synthase I